MQLYDYTLIILQVYTFENYLTAVKILRTAEFFPGKALMRPPLGQASFYGATPIGEGFMEIPSENG